MYDSYKIMKHLEKEMDKKAETGLRNMSDLDSVVKLAQAMKDLAKTDYYCVVTEAMEQEGYSQEDGYSERRKRDSMGRYSRHDGYDRGSSYNHGGYSEAKEEYMGHKNSYRSTRSPESKRDMTASLHDCMEKLKMELDEMEANADSREEREKIREMRKEIGKLA